MDNTQESIIIPYDFDETSEFALQHAILLAKVVGNKLLLVHVLAGAGLFGKKDKVEESKEEAINKLIPVSDATKAKYNIKPEIIVRDGNIAKIFKEIVDEHKVNLIVMGKEYKVGNTTVSFKDFLKISEESNTPVIQATAPPTHSHYSEVVVTLDHNKKYKEKLNWIIYLSKYYNFNVNILKTFVSDELLKKQMSNNIFFTKKMLDNKKIIYGIKTAKKEFSFSEEIYRFAGDIDADLIVVMTPEYNAYLQKNNNDENSTVPIMCVNPRTDLQKFGGFN